MLSTLSVPQMMQIMLRLLDFIMFMNVCSIFYILTFNTVSSGTMVEKIVLTSVVMCSIVLIPTVIIGAAVHRRLKKRGYV